MAADSAGQGGESSPDYKNIFWLASFPKSGSTWMRAMLSAYINAGYIDINKIVGSYGDTDGYFIQAASPKDPYDLSYMERLMLRPSMLMHMQATSLFEPVVVKTHSINTAIEGVQTIPHHLTAGAIVIARDPRDVVVSYADHMGRSLDDAIDAMSEDHTALRDTSSKDIKTYLGSWSTHMESWMGDNPFPVSVITYEQMLKNPRWALRTVMEKIGWPVDPERLKAAVNACHFTKLQRQEAQNGFKEKSDKSERFFRKGRAGAWGEALNQKQVARIEEAHGDMMRALGYLPQSADAVAEVAAEVAA